MKHAAEASGETSGKETSGTANASGQNHLKGGRSAIRLSQPLNQQLQFEFDDEPASHRQKRANTVAEYTTQTEVPNEYKHSEIYWIFECLGRGSNLQPSASELCDIVFSLCFAYHDVANLLRFFMVSHSHWCQTLVSNIGVKLACCDTKPHHRNRHLHLGDHAHQCPCDLS